METTANQVHAVDGRIKRPTATDAVVSPTSMRSTTMTVSNTVMAIFQFDDPIRRLFETIVRPLIETHTGLKYVDGASYYEPFTVKMSLISKMIEESRLVIVDISKKNPNVFLELGVAHSLNKPIVFLCSKASWEGTSTEDWNRKVPFDMEGRELLIFHDENDLKVKLGRFISDSLHKTREVALSWTSKVKDNHIKSSSEIEIFGPGEVWSASAVHSNFVINYHVTLHDVKQPGRNPDVRLYISDRQADYPRIVNIFPWEFSEIDKQKYECHIDYFPSPSGQNHVRLQQVSVGPNDINLIKSFDVSISFCWPNLVLESTFFENKVDRLYVSLSELRNRGYPIHFAQYIGFESINSRVTIDNIRVKEIFI